MKKYDYTKSYILEAIKNVAIYLRKSRGEGEEDLERHRSVILDYCKKYNWNYIEYGEIVSGENINNRPKFQELLKEIEDETFDAVFVYDYDRLGRGSGTDQEIIIQTLMNSGTLVIEANPFNILNVSDERDEETIEFKGFIARREYKMIRKRLFAGKKISLKNGQWVNGNAPFGYIINKDNKKLQVNKEQKDIFRNEILYSYLIGESASNIVKKLKETNIITNTGANWNTKGVLFALTNRTYLGHTYYNKRDKKGKLKPVEEWSVTLNSHEAIMSEDELKKIIEIKEGRRTGKKTFNVLSGMVKCYNCGATMRIKKDSGKPKLHRCLSCNNNRGGSLELVNEAITTSLEELIIAIDKENSEENSKVINDFKKELKTSNLNIKKIEKAILEIEEGYECGSYSLGMAKEKLNRSQLEMIEEMNTSNILIQRINELKDGTLGIKKDVIETWLKIIKEDNDDEGLSQIYQSFINKIIWERSEWNEIKISVVLKK